MRSLTLALFMLATFPITEAQAFDFAISNFTVLRDGATMFEDSFTGTTPPAAPNYKNGNPASYYLPAGSFSPAVGGKLHLNSAAGTISPAVSSALGVAAHLNSNKDPSDTTIGLKPGHTIEVSGIWDTATPADSREGYWIELGDWVSNTCECLRVGVVKTTEGAIVIRFWRDSISNDAVQNRTVLGEAAFTPGANQQIRFKLTKASASSNAVTASYAYVNDGVAGTEVALAGTTDLFTAQGFATAAFKAFAPVAYANTSGTNSKLSVTANINVDNSHAGKTGNIYVLAVFQGLIFVHNGSTWLAWNGGTLPAYASDVALTDRGIKILDGLDVSSLTGTTIYVGYGRDQNDLVSTQAYNIVHTIQ